DIEGLLSITNPSVSSIISSMEKKDLIFKRKDPKDKRNQLLYLTKPGYELAKESSKVMIENNQKTFGVLNEEEQNQLNTLLTKLFERSEDLK
ncbi:MAG: winged helix-turn-helix transcriptional regulator, partial [Clostridium sp.]|nr:winged helix-turn-helix transcriptional regulator [Clostridium sp.]